jgi:hypothetical protein
LTDTLSAIHAAARSRSAPLVCLDETSKQLLAETRVPIPMKAGRVARFDYEYERNGTANLFMMFAPLEGWRYVKVTDRHTAVDYAHVLKDLADRHFPRVRTIVLVQDNLNIHSKASLYEAFPAAEARRLVERFEWLCLSKIKAGHIGGAARRELGGKESARPVRRYARTAHPSPRRDVCGLHYNISCTTAAGGGGGIR